MSFARTMERYGLTGRQRLRFKGRSLDLLYYAFEIEDTDPTRLHLVRVEDFWRTPEQPKSGFFGGDRRRLREKPALTASATGVPYIRADALKPGDVAARRGNPRSLMTILETEPLRESRKTRLTYTLREKGRRTCESFNGEKFILHSQA